MTTHENDPLAIFNQTDTSAHSDNHASSSSSSSNPFDPLGAGGSQSSLKSPEKSSGGGGDDNSGPLDLMSQISNWGAQNKDPSSSEEQESKTAKEAAPHSPTSTKNVMATKQGAITLSDDLVAEAHREFEATKDALEKFEQSQ